MLILPLLFFWRIEPGEKSPNPCRNNECKRGYYVDYPSQRDLVNPIGRVRIRDCAYATKKKGDEVFPFSPKDLCPERCCEPIGNCTGCQYDDNKQCVIFNDNPDFPVISSKTCDECNPCELCHPMCCWMTHCAHCVQSSASITGCARKGYPSTHEHFTCDKPCCEYRCSKRCGKGYAEIPGAIPQRTCRVQGVVSCRLHCCGL